jgi:hypothetical protein
VTHESEPQTRIRMSDDHEYGTAATWCTQRAVVVETAEGGRPMPAGTQRKCAAESFVGRRELACRTNRRSAAQALGGGRSRAVHDVLRSPVQDWTETARSSNHALDRTSAAFACTRREERSPHGRRCGGLRGRTRCGVWRRPVCAENPGPPPAAHEITHTLQQGAAAATLICGLKPIEPGRA